MGHLGINIFFEGANFLRLLGGLYVSAKIAFLSIVFGGILGIVLGVLRTLHNPLLRLLLRLYLEFFRIVPTIVL
ncbi:amino acid ABC transporter permease, partial [Anaerostipes hadrus]|nr:amino acid ABC transporter permease [Anaerostipes hadrus]